MHLCPLEAHLCRSLSRLGIANYGTLLLINSTISDNTLEDGAGPAFDGGFGNLGAATLTNVAVSRNERWIGYRSGVAGHA
jgi:hypothetical protein